jgi:hypothetical protein
MRYANRMTGSCFVFAGCWASYRMDGYPGCGDRDEPAYCTDGGLYGDVNYCNFGAFWSFDANGQPREASMSCDGSFGMSGSGVYWMDWWFTGLPKVTGQYNGADCIATDCVGNSFPNQAGLITSEYASAIDYFNANFP